MRPALSRRLGVQLTGLELIKDNGRCFVYRGLRPDNDVIIKQYRSRDATLARREVHALHVYDEVCEDVPEALPVRVLAFDPETHTFCMEYVHGATMAQALERARGNSVREAAVARAMTVVGALLRALYERTRRSGVTPSPFLKEYLQHVSNGLRSVPLLGRTVFESYPLEAAALWDDLIQTGEPTSMIHGDPSLNNILVRGNRVGLIDFANTNDAAHLLADAYGLSVCLRTKRMSKGFRQQLFDALHQGMGGGNFTDAAHRFYWEWHRRRWLFLKLSSGGAGASAEGIRSLPELGASLAFQGTG